MVIAHSPASSRRYIGSPSIAVLPGGDYVASHDFFGPASGEFQRADCHVYRSSDRGRSWRRVSEVHGSFWSTLWVHRRHLYLLGLDRHHGGVVIRRSEDGGRTWTEPSEGGRGVIRADAEYHGAAVPVLEHGGRLWRAFEWRNPPKSWGVNYRAGVLSAPVDADLLDPASWTASEFLPSDRSWNGGDMGGWLEGNLVVAPNGTLVNLLRVDTQGYPEKAAWVEVDPDGKKLRFDPATGFIDFPGGAKKFTVRFDPETRLYWSVATVVPAGWVTAGRPAKVRNTLALTSSPDLRHWTVRSHLLHHHEHANTGFQYVDWMFEGADLIAVYRMAYDDGVGGARNEHDSNFMTFHRIKRFRSRTLADSVPMTRLEP